MTAKEALRILGQMTTKRNLQDFPIGNQPKQFAKMKIKEMPEFSIVKKYIRLCDLYRIATDPHTNWCIHEQVTEEIEALEEEMK